MKGKHSLLTTTVHAHICIDVGFERFHPRMVWKKQGEWSGGMAQ